MIAWAKRGFAARSSFAGGAVPCQGPAYMKYTAANT